MTDNEIVKALECCMGCNCKECPYCDDEAEECMGKLIVEALKLVNRQKAEIERLKEAYAVYEETTGLKRARAEAVKKFAERLRTMAFVFRANYEDGSITRFVCVDDIDKLVEEMTEEAKHE